jgi:SAM-dependent methyltransferase
MDPHEDAVLSAQLTYYRLRAEEYDDDLYRDPAIIRGFEAILGDLEPSGRTLELACGTGVWTALLAARVPSLTALDGSPEMLARARRRSGTAAVRFVEADVFDWRPDEDYETVFFAFWLSHVPPGRFEQFWELVSEALVPGGRALFVDTGPLEANVENFVQTTGIPTVERPLRDGSSHRVVKVLYAPADLVGRLGALGWDAEVSPAGGSLFAGRAARASSG